MSIVTLHHEKKEGVGVAWVDYSSRLLFTIRDYQGSIVQLTEEQLAFVLEFLARYPLEQEVAEMGAFHLEMEEGDE